MIRTIVSVDGMACGMCEAHINETIRKNVPDEKKVSSSHKKGEASFLTESAPDLDALREAINKTGYVYLSGDSSPYVKKGLFG